GFIRCAWSVGADLGNRNTARLGNDRRDDRAADPALAGTHAATGERLQLVRSRRAKADRAADPADRHLLAAADDRVILGRRQDRPARAIERVEKRPDRPLASQPGADRPGAA